MTKLIVIGLALIVFTWLNAAISGSVSQYQLDAVYRCSEPYSVCMGTFGNIVEVRRDR